MNLQQRTATLGVALIMSLSFDEPAEAAPGGFNYDESKVPEYTLPDSLVLKSGEKVTDAETWRTKRRPEVFAMLETQMFGRAPGKPNGMRFETREEKKGVLGGIAKRRQVRIHLSDEDGGPFIDLLLYTPMKADKPVAAFAGLNFGGNHTVNADPDIRLPESWVRGGKNNRAVESDRGKAAGRWQVETVVKRGYALAVAYYGDIDPDTHDGFKNGVHVLDNTPRTPESWGSTAAWAWGLSRILDYLETDKAVDAKQVAVMGHSRLGKTALWAGASDARFALTISNDSGCGGAALSRRAFGETVKRINTSFPHWFCDNYKQFNDRENEAPFDQHMLIALCAPRPVLVCSAQEDQWADPHGEFLSARHADSVYKLLGTKGIPRTEMPGVNDPVLGTIGYHIRPGKHDVTARDWEVYLQFADMHLGK